MHKTQCFVCTGCGRRILLPARPQACPDCTGAVTAFAADPIDEQAAAVLDAALAMLGETADHAARGRGVARYVALEALSALHPGMAKSDLAKRLGYPSPRSARSSLHTARHRIGWTDVLVDDVIGTVVAPLYGERAA
jgi:hypothetical protein